ncbi:DNA polymerase III, alpha subunit [Segniliparus rotundus DSM 44985]|uniref:DNA polymerase III subunit alpha n=1 Tax=Segniliparus rotundus (strain ATCC BAA-972 / CDC 1076 / CIP 108378 / DSM 44985 / JCM 13578) TaxID=640132 RepID=D6Z7G5_SEGRD|nr:DNA polymerase III subunit alpha [Segniliparus rotundus]ADG97895.1 DNA polymerase III, alpha subunit [Segniliparus rotundus DSM 44985]
MSDSFVHLHNHTEYSLLDGHAQVDAMFQEAARLKMPAVGMTDHGNMWGSAEFYKASKKHGVKPIIGIEAYLAPSSRFSTKREFWGEPGQRSDDVSGSGAYTHMTMVAKDAQGLRNLMKLSSLASFEGQLGKWPRMDAELLAEHGRGVIATTGCPSGEVQTKLRLGQFEAACEAAGRFQEIFGKENFYLELMDHGIDIERRVREDLLRLGERLKIPPLATNDCHYVRQEHARGHEILLCVQTGKTMSDPGRFKFDGDGYYLKPADMMRAAWDSEVPGACDNTLLIAEQVGSYDEVWEVRDRMPVFPVPDGEDQNSWLRHEVDRGLQRRFPDGVSDEYRARAAFELDVIKQKGFPSYFLIVGDLIAYARSVGIRVGPGRGSAAGSLVSYALGITNLDPIKHGLLFERFLNPERPSAPDIDIDFDDRRRGEMIRYASEKWGADRVAQVITFGTIKTKAALKDSARVLHGQPGFAIADRITKALPPAIMAKDIPLSGITNPEHERYKEATEIRELIANDPDVAKIYETALSLEGLIRNAGVHACAIIMSNEPLIETIPLWKRPQDGAIITGWDYPSCEDIGLLKMDFLGLRNLTVIGDAIENIRQNRGVELDLENAPLDDPATFALLSRGETLGVFQLDGGPMRDLLRRMKPTGFGDIVAVLSLYRPGPMGVNAHNDYADRKNGRQQIKPIHPELEEPLKEILSETYGLIVYQEQIMFIAQKVAGYSMGKADALRKAMGKKKLEVLQAEYEGFSQGMRGNGFSEAAVKALWDTVLPFADYAFNKSHAACYALVAYWTGYLKANYPAEYMAALLTSVGDDKDKAAVYLADCRKMGITVLAPDVNKSRVDFAAVGEDILFGLSGVRNVGVGLVESIIRTRESEGAFTSFSDYLAKADITACNKKAVESLIKAGGFDALGHPRKGLYLVHTEAVDAVMSTKKAEAQGQYDLFSDFFESGSPELTATFEVQIPDEEWDMKQKLALEREMLGLYVSGHPLAGLEQALAAATDVSIRSILDGEVKDGTNVKVGGVLSGVNRRVNKNGAPYASAQLEDLVGGIEVFLFPQNYVAYGEEFVEDAVVLINARVNFRDDRIALIASDVRQAELTPQKAANTLRLSVAESWCNPDSVAQLREILERNPGPTQVLLDLHRGGKALSFQLDEALTVMPSPELYGDLKALIGPGCLG